MEWQYGIDTASHRVALEANGKTIAVLGNGLNHIFPAENKGLYKEILEKGGLVITEYPPETKAKSEYFLERNRIVSGIALGILVIEAAHRSGTSVTAKLAEEQGRKVFVLPHELEDIHGIGTNRLIQKGAILITSTKDIINEFKFLTYKQVEKKEESKITKSKKEEPKNKKNIITKKPLKNLEYQEIYNLISNEIISINEIYQKSSQSISKINQALFMLEIEGYIQKKAGGYKCV